MGNEWLTEQLTLAFIFIESYNPNSILMAVARVWQTHGVELEHKNRNIFK